MDMLIFPAGICRGACVRFPSHMILYNTFVCYYSRSLVGKPIWKPGNGAAVLPINWFMLLYH